VRAVAVNEPPICHTCGVQHAAAERLPETCAICEDPRQWVPADGQRWTTMRELAATHVNHLRRDGGLVGIATEPRFAIGQRALLVPSQAGNVLWECVSLLDDATAEAVDALGGLAAIAISHPHYYSAMVEWAHRFECPVLLHRDDARWIMRPDPAIELWDGETRELGELTLLRLGGHFRGATVLHRPDGAGTLLSGDVVQVIPDRGWVSFMYSYPNLIPLPAAEVERMAAALEPYAFDALQGAWWETTIPRDAKAIVRRSAERYVRALAGEMP
jgi:hypothetical protein